ncbi:hypothetical protein K474DRAFT_1680970, partial [Panus rudis PR-1116 ss-1]
MSLGSEITSRDVAFELHCERSTKGTVTRNAVNSRGLGDVSPSNICKHPHNISPMTPQSTFEQGTTEHGCQPLDAVAEREWEAAFTIREACAAEPAGMTDMEYYHYHRTVGGRVFSLVYRVLVPGAPLRLDDRSSIVVHRYVDWVASLHTENVPERRNALLQLFLRTGSIDEDEERYILDLLAPPPKITAVWVNLVRQFNRLRAKKGLDLLQFSKTT